MRLKLEGVIGRQIMWKQDQARVKLEGSDRQGNNMETGQ